MAARDNIGGLLRTLAGPGIWFAAFSLLYAIATAGCVGLIASAKPVASWVVVLAGVSALLWLAHVPAKWAPVRRQEHAPQNNSRACTDSEGTGHALGVFGAGRGNADPFLALLTRLLAIVSLVATLWLLLPLAALQTC